MIYETSLPRSVVIDICIRLGHNPADVSEIVLSSDTVKVMYEHRITDSDDE
jgi:hypothetical protein